MKLFMYMFEIDQFKWFPHEVMGGKKNYSEYIFVKKSLKDFSEGLLDCHYLTFRIKIKKKKNCSH